MTQQLACTYAALILQELNKSDAESLRTVAAAAGVEVSQGMAAAFSKALGAVGIAEVLRNINFGGGVAGAAPVRDAATSSAAAPAAEKENAKEEKPDEEEDDDIGFSLFD